MKNKDIISAAEKYIETAEKNTYAIRKAFIDGARWMNEQEVNNLSLGSVVNCTTCFFFNEVKNNCDNCDAINGNFTKYSQK